VTGKVHQDIHIEAVAGERVTRNIGRGLAEAERLLRPATHRADDPIAAVALARVLELKADRGCASQRSLRREAAELVQQAASLILPDVDERVVQDIVQARGRVLAREWLVAAKSWLWPADSECSRPLMKLLSSN
jgi:hypothetical protein